MTDDKPLLALFGPSKPIPGLAGNRLARWALFLSQFTYTIECRKTNLHKNTDALNRLLSGKDPAFDNEKGEEDMDVVCVIHALESQLMPAH